MEEEIARRAGRGRAHAVLLPAIGLLAGAAYTAGALRYPTGTLEAPAAGLFPVLVGALLAGSSLLALIAAWRRPGPPPEPPGPHIGRIPLVAFGLAASFSLLETAGFPLAAGALGALVLAVCGRRPLWALLLLAGAISVTTALGFRLLGVPLPGVPPLV